MTAYTRGFLAALRNERGSVLGMMVSTLGMTWGAESSSLNHSSFNPSNPGSDGASSLDSRVRGNDDVVTLGMTGGAQNGVGELLI